ncbi:hypothetical protein BC828DRAFT_382601 [Blastocladiella britannica]|nr:hypothetical protein BC828DRAFT_382601 [Blastocladiella britannica]
MQVGRKRQVGKPTSPYPMTILHLPCDIINAVLVDAVRTGFDRTHALTLARVAPRSLAHGMHRAVLRRGYESLRPAAVLRVAPDAETALWLLQQFSTFTLMRTVRSIMVAAAASDFVSVLEWVRTRPALGAAAFWSEAAVRATLRSAGSARALAVLDWLWSIINHGKDAELWAAVPTPEAALLIIQKAAAAAGHIDVLQWSHSRATSLDPVLRFNSDVISETAAAHNRMHVLEWLPTAPTIDRPREWTTRMVYFSRIMRAGSRETLAWMLMHAGVPGPDGATYNFVPSGGSGLLCAAAHGNVALLEMWQEAVKAGANHPGGEYARFASLNLDMGRAMQLATQRGHPAVLTWIQNYAASLYEFDDEWAAFLEDVRVESCAVLDWWHDHDRLGIAEVMVLAIADAIRRGWLASLQWWWRWFKADNGHGEKYFNYRWKDNLFENLDGSAATKDILEWWWDTIASDSEKKDCLWMFKVASQCKTTDALEWVLPRIAANAEKPVDIHDLDMIFEVGLFELPVTHILWWGQNATDYLGAYRVLANRQVLQQLAKANDALALQEMLAMPKFVDQLVRSSILTTSLVVEAMKGAQSAEILETWFAMAQHAGLLPIAGEEDLLWIACAEGRVDCLEWWWWRSRSHPRLVPFVHTSETMMAAMDEFQIPVLQWWRTLHTRRRAPLKYSLQYIPEPSRYDELENQQLMFKWWHELQRSLPRGELLAEWDQLPSGPVWRIVREDEPHGLFKIDPVGSQPGGVRLVGGPTDVWLWSPSHDADDDDDLQSVVSSQYSEYDYDDDSEDDSFFDPEFATESDSE